MTLKMKLMVLACCFLIGQLQAQLKSPEQYLGYKIGTKFTPHWKIVDYFKYVASAEPATVVLQQYGETQEGRPLYVCFVSSAENVQNRETIRENNLALAGIDKNKTGSRSGPVTVWLTYNVHGNEAASSEAAMLTLYALANKTDSEKQQWLKNTLVIIDPCMNPDGRDRYVNWYNSVVGKNYNANPVAREHREPWPGGRSNHYNFDMNRDWVWQTQKETQERMALFTSWLPQVHVDYHEQGYNNPYYFAPAAAPFHEVISPWQRAFQDTIGHNHARYFDKNGWLFFTKDAFDLFYPSYGDTYPLYSGSIGMTYEQGGIGAGLGVVTRDQDTLTFVDRVEHHFITGLSTVETASRQAAQLLQHYYEFYRDAPRVGDYKTYIIKNNEDSRERILALKNLLDKNGIVYGAASGSGKGYEYNSGKESSYTIGPKDMVVSSNQPKGVLVKVLFEPKSNLLDSITYDITSWALPYVYGLNVYASRQPVEVRYNKTADSVLNKIDTNAYGYAIRWQGIPSVTATAQLLKRGIRLRFTDLPFEEGGKKYDRGTVLVLKKGNDKYGNGLWSAVATICDSLHVQMNLLTTGMVDKGGDMGSRYIHPMKAPKVALITGETVSSLAAGEVWYFFEQHLDYPLTLVNAADFSRMKLSDFDVIVLPDGVYRFLSNTTDSIALLSWVRNGGKIIALESTVPQLGQFGGGLLKVKADKTQDSATAKTTYADLYVYENRDRDEVSKETPGAIFKVDLDNTHPLAFGFPNYYYTLKMDTHIYQFLKEGGWNVGVIKKDNQLAGFVGSKLQKKLKDGLLLGVQDVGQGELVYLADDLLFRDFWENGKIMFSNAVFLVGQ